MAVQDHLHDVLSWGAGDRYPVYAAYREYRYSLEVFMAGDAPPHLLKAIALDPDFARPRILAGAYWSPRLAPSVHSWVVEFYQPVHDMQLTPGQQRLVGMIDRRMEGQWEDAFRIAREELDRHPEDSIRRLQVVRSAGWANRPEAAIEAYRALAARSSRTEWFQVQRSPARLRFVPPSRKIRRGARSDPGYRGCGTDREHGSSITVVGSESFGRPGSDRRGRSNSERNPPDTRLRND